MGPKCKPVAKSFEFMPNFRVVGGINDSGNVDKLPPLVYRSSRPDFLREDDVSEFLDLGINTILDFRSSTEYRKHNGEKLLDNIYPLYKIKVPFTGIQKPDQPIQYKSIELPSPKEPLSEDVMKKAPNNPKHFLLDFFKVNYVWAVFNRAPLWFRFFSLLYLIADLILRTGFRLFVGVFAKKVLNKAGIVGQYKDMINYSQAAILIALKLLSEPENIPAMINCAHGKDRTGIISAMVLACLGRSKHEIAEDFARSEVELEPIKERVKREIVDKFALCPTFALAKYDSMMQTLDYIEQSWGSIPNYLNAIGFGEQDQEKLAKNLVSYANSD